MPLTIERYLAGLPQGVDSYPAFEQKGTIVRSYVDSGELDVSGVELPPAVRAWVASPPTATQWIPEVHANVLFLVMMGKLGETGFEDLVYRANTRLLQGPLYAILFKLVSPERVLRASGARWSQFHRGIELAPIRPGHNEASVDMRCPLALLPAPLARVYATAFRAALEAAGGKEVRVEMVGERPDGYTFHATWH